MKMRRVAFAAAFAVLSVIANLPPAPLADTNKQDFRTGQSFAPLIELTAPAVVNIYAQKVIRNRSATRYLDGSAFWRLFRDTLLFGYGQDRIENSLGSGVIVAANGIIVTNHHVVANAEGIVVALASGHVFAANVLVSDPRTDISVLRIDAGGASLPFIPFGDSDEVRVGDQVIAIGNPFGLGQTVTTGIVSAQARTSFGVTDIRFFIQTDAAINPGNSGGAQITLDGKLAGINTAIYTTSGGSQGLGFAIPSNMVRAVVESAVSGKPLVRPWIGVSGSAVTPQMAAQLGLPSPQGVFVSEVLAGGPANAAGLQYGDVILAVDQSLIKDLDSLRYRIATRPAGSTAALTVVRGGILHRVSIALQPPPDIPPRNIGWTPNLSPLRGARIASLSPAFAEEIGVDSGLSGVVVLDVGVAAAAGRFGLRAGDIIRSIDGKPVRSVDELLAFPVVPMKPWRLIVTRAGQTLAFTGNSFAGFAVPPD